MIIYFLVPDGVLVKSGNILWDTERKYSRLPVCRVSLGADREGAIVRGGASVT
jgi:hypothetical protein